MVPSTHASRLFSVLVVLLGLAVLSMVTAAVAAIFVEVEERQIERDLLHEIGNLRAEVRELRELLQNGHAAPSAAGAAASAAAATEPRAPSTASGPRGDQARP
jgi:voltage-gated potassium channel